MVSTFCLQVRRTTGKHSRRLDHMNEYCSNTSARDRAAEDEDILVRAGIDPEALGYFTDGKHSVIHLKKSLT